MDEVKIHCKNIDAATAVRKLRAIHDDVQGKFHDQWDWMGADFCVEVLATLLTASEVQVAALTPCESPDPELCDNQNCHPRACHCNDPLYWRKKCAALTEQLRLRSLPVSDEEWPKTWDGSPRPSITLSVFNKMVAARSAAPGKEREDGK